MQIIFSKKEKKINFSLRLTSAFPSRPSLIFQRQPRNPLKTNPFKFKFQFSFCIKFGHSWMRANIIFPKMNWKKVRARNIRRNANQRKIEITTGKRHFSIEVSLSVFGSTKIVTRTFYCCVIYCCWTTDTQKYCFPLLPFYLSLFFFVPLSSLFCARNANFLFRFFSRCSMQNIFEMMKCDKCTSTPFKSRSGRLHQNAKHRRRPSRWK